MRQLALFAVVGIAALLLTQQSPAPWPVPSPTPTPAPADGPDLVSCFRETDNLAQARSDAQLLGLICESFADVIESDGRLPQPGLTSGEKLDRVRRRLRQNSTGNWSFQQRYRLLAPTLDGWLQPRLGDKAGPIDESQRRAWIDAYRRLAAAARHASSAL